MGNEFEFGNEEVVNLERSERNAIEAVNKSGASGAEVKTQPGSAKKQMGWKIATGVLALLVVVLGGFLAWRMLAKEAPAECQDPTIGDNVDSDDAAEVLLAQDARVREVVASVRLKAEELLDPYKLWDNIYDVTVPYKPEGFLTAIQLNRGYGFKVERSDNPTLVETIQGINWSKELGDVLEERGFVDTGERYTLSSTAGAAGTLFLSNESGVVCEVFAEPRVNCSHKDWYDKADAELANELSKVFEDATGEEVGYLVAEVSDIQDSSVAPYQRIYVGRSGYRSSFYRVSPEAEWVYFYSGQDRPACDEYNTEDLRRAFAGQFCWAEGGGDSEVQP